MACSTVMLALVASIYVLNTASIKEGVDGRHKADHDDRGSLCPLRPDELVPFAEGDDHLVGLQRQLDRVVGD